jgi:hypothetical protein
VTNHRRHLQYQNILFGFIFFLFLFLFLFLCSHFQQKCG